MANDVAVKDASRGMMNTPAANSQEDTEDDEDNEGIPKK